MHRTPIAPLDVEIDGVGKYAPASSVEDPTAPLTSLEWPNKKPKEFHRAMVSSFDTLDHVIEPAAAREAFVNAAHAVGTHVIPDDRPRSEGELFAMVTAKPLQSSDEPLRGRAQAFIIRL